MRLLFDTHLLLWVVAANEDVQRRLLPQEAVAMVQDANNELYFSAVSVWEVAIKQAVGKSDFQVEPYVFTQELLQRGYIELAITSAHAARVAELPKHHKDPFDRLLVAQALVEGITLLTVDTVLATYAGPLRRV